jgi:hypothetical protein
MTRLIQVAAELQGFLDSRSWPNCIIGGVAVQRWGEPRLTQDVDVTLLAGFGNEEPYIDALLGRYEARIATPREFALAHRVVLARSRDGIGIDIALGGLPFEANAVGRATEYEFVSGERLRTCSAEDLIVMKAIAGREQDWLDIKGIVARQESKLDWKLILTEIDPLCELKETPDVIDRLKQLAKGQQLRKPRQ